MFHNEQTFFSHGKVAPLSIATTYTLPNHPTVYPVKWATWLRMYWAIAASGARNGATPRSAGAHVLVLISFSTLFVFSLLPPHDRHPSKLRQKMKMNHTPSHSTLSQQVARIFKPSCSSRGDDHRIQLPSFLSSIPVCLARVPPFLASFLPRFDLDNATPA